MSLAIEIYSFLVRLYHYEDNVLHEAEAELKQSSGISLEDLHDLFYRCFIKGFCKQKTEKQKALRPTINLHTFSHLLESRRRSGPVHKTSTEAFESMYGVLRRCYRPGTRNTGKQAFENFYIKHK